MIHTPPPPPADSAKLAIGIPGEQPSDAMAAVPAAPSEGAASRAAAPAPEKAAVAPAPKPPRAPALAAAKPAAPSHRGPSAADRLRIVGMLTNAKIALGENRLMSPPGDNAYDRYRSVLRLEPGNSTAKSGLRDIASR